MLQITKIFLWLTETELNTKSFRTMVCFLFFQVRQHVWSDQARIFQSFRKGLVGQCLYLMLKRYYHMIFQRGTLLEARRRWSLGCPPTVFSALFLRRLLTCSSPVSGQLVLQSMCSSRRFQGSQGCSLFGCRCPVSPLEVGNVFALSARRVQKGFNIFITPALLQIPLSMKMYSCRYSPSTPWRDDEDHISIFDIIVLGRGPHNSSPHFPALLDVMQMAVSLEASLLTTMNNCFLTRWRCLVYVCTVSRRNVFLHCVFPIV